MADFARFNELALKIGSKYDYLRVWVDETGLNVYNLSNNKQLTLYYFPIFDLYGIIENKANGEWQDVKKPQFDRALNHLQRIADNI